MILPAVLPWRLIFHAGASAFPREDCTTNMENHATLPREPRNEPPPMRPSAAAWFTTGGSGKLRMAPAPTRGTLVVRWRHIRPATREE